MLEVIIKGKYVQKSNENKTYFSYIKQIEETFKKANN